MGANIYEIEKGVLKHPLHPQINLALEGEEKSPPKCIGLSKNFLTHSDTLLIKNVNNIMHFQPLHFASSNQLYAVLHQLIPLKQIS